MHWNPFTKRQKVEKKKQQKNTLILNTKHRLVFVYVFSHIPYTCFDLNEKEGENTNELQTITL